VKYVVVTIAFAVIILSYPSGVFPQGANQQSANLRKSERKTKVDLRYDKKKDITTVWLEYMPLWKNPLGFEQVDISFSFDYPKRTIVTPTSVSVIVHSATKGWPLFENKCDLIMMADGSSFSFGDMKGGCNHNRNRASGRDTFLERLSAAIPFDDLSRIAKAKEVKIQIGGRTYDLSEKHVQSLNDFVELMRQEGQEFK
jgi:hypothetical protein